LRSSRGDDVGWLLLRVPLEVDAAGLELPLELLPLDELPARLLLGLLARESLSRLADGRLRPAMSADSAGRPREVP
jgi:hypothetical protein